MDNILAVRRSWHDLTLYDALKWQNNNTTGVASSSLHFTFHLHRQHQQPINKAFFESLLLNRPLKIIFSFQNINLCHCSLFKTNGWMPYSTSSMILCLSRTLDPGGGGVLHPNFGGGVPLGFYIAYPEYDRRTLIFLPCLWQCMWFCTPVYDKPKIALPCFIVFILGPDKELLRKEIFKKWASWTRFWLKACPEDEVHSNMFLVLLPSHLTNLCVAKWFTDKRLKPPSRWRSTFPRGFSNLCYPSKNVQGLTQHSYHF